ncbi:hypothetical protein RGQ29_015131 [Quercus rubra]|uniref:HAT C-terminal dimerisation domain-containing protein n=1 Tax=Quercus rubra TaxID=3512 RepID=A0AAN7J3Z0_QUERU|nr:hypothetical protein RGQ29_015131 [Quercus rubra]
MSLNTYQFDQVRVRNKLTRMVILHEYPLLIVNHIGFREFVAELQPMFKLVTRNTLKSDILKIYDNEREKALKITDKNGSRMAITTDIWTSSNKKRGFITLQNRVVRFVYVSSPHSKDVLVDYFLEWNIDRKLSTIIIDNCSTNDAMIRLLLNKLDTSSLMLGESILHMRYGLFLIGDGIKRIRDKLAKDICGRLELFHSVTEFFFGRKYPTTNMYFTLVLSSNEMITAILNSRYKMKLLEFYYPNIYGNLCYDLLDEYGDIDESSVDNEGSSHIPASTSSPVAQMKFRLSGAMSSFDLFVNNSSSSSKKHGSAIMEFDHFIDEKVLKRSEDFDILGWIARDILAIRVTTVASESAFSTSGRLLSPHRSRLHPKTIEAMMCAQN